MGLASTLLPLMTPAALEGAALARLRGGLRSAFGRVSRRSLPALDTLVLGLAGADRPGGEKAAEALKRGFKPWTRLAAASPELVAQALRPIEPDLGRALVRAERLIAALRRLIARSGGLSLDFLADKPPDEALAWLSEALSLSKPLAVAVLTASPIRHRLVHVQEAGLRALARWSGAPPTPELAKAVRTDAPSGWTGEDLFELSGLLQALGEAVCLASRPDCAECPVSKGCAWAEGKTEQNENKNGGLASLLRRRIRRLEGTASGAACDGLRLGGAAFGIEVLPQGLTPGVHQVAPTGAAHGAAPFILVAATVAAACTRRDPASSGRRVKAGPPSASALSLILVQEIDALAEHGELFAPGLKALGLDPLSVAMVRVGSGAEAMRVVDEALKLKAAPVVAVELRRGEGAADLVASRRLGLSARRAGVWLWLITPDLSNTSAALTRWRVGAAPSGLAGRRRIGAPAFSLELTRNRQGPLGAWTLEWDIDEHCLRTPGTRARPAAPPGSRPLPAPALPAAVDRSAGPAPAGLAAA